MKCRFLRGGVGGWVWGSCCIFFFVFFVFFSYGDDVLKELNFLVDRNDVKSVVESNVLSVIIVFDLNSSEVVEFVKNDDLINFSFEFLFLVNVIEGLFI